MDRRTFLGAPAALLAGGVAQPGGGPQRGVSLAGAEFGADRKGFSCRSPGVAGRDYTWNSEATVCYFAAQGIRLLRIPFRWERIQPRLGDDLDAKEMRSLRRVVGWARKHRCAVILDVHNYARYTLPLAGKPMACAIDQKVNDETPVPRKQFADLWRRLSKAFRDEPAVWAYGLMNEPHDMGKSDWKAISQAAVDAIRGGKDDHPVLVCGDGWSSAHSFAKANGRAWIKDPANKTLYEAHCYFDHDNSGRYAKSYAAERALDANLARRPAERLGAFVRWCRENKVRGFIGEFGAPGSDGWLVLLRSFVKALDGAGMEGCYWAAGEWWGAYPLSLQPRGGFRKHAPQFQFWKP
jgi:endoglucanase